MFLENVQLDPQELSQHHRVHKKLFRFNVLNPEAGSLSLQHLNKMLTSPQMAGR